MHGLSFSGILAGIYLITLIIGAYTAAFPVRRHFQAEKRKNQRIEDALLGTEATKELPGTPSLFFQVKEIKADLTEVKSLTRQLKANGGKSLYDKVNQIAIQLEDHIHEDHGITA